MKHLLISGVAAASTVTPEIMEQLTNTNPLIEGSGLLVQLVTAIIAIVSFFKGLKKK